MEEDNLLKDTIERLPGLYPDNIKKASTFETRVQRDSLGRLLPGSVLNPGGMIKHEKIEVGLYRHLLKVQGKTDQTRYEAMLDKLTADAAQGDKDARELVLAYLHGKPTVRQEITGANGGPLEVDSRALLLAKLEQIRENKDG